MNLNKSYIIVTVDCTKLKLSILNTYIQNKNYFMIQPVYFVRYHIVILFTRIIR